ncbi:MAG: D-alanyl-D-alanine carboxypeptidase [Candidatus Pacebacteria bacterium]|nr:D-alanyl-D-alanine carboxypeptidase [Candidatus Paceibacterota bacterium]
MTPIREAFPQKPRSPFLGILACSVCLAFIAGLFFFSVEDSAREPEPIVEATTTPSDTNPSFAGISFEAKAVYVIDVRDDAVLYAKNSDIALPLASVSKLLTALTVSKSLSADTIVTITPESLTTDGESGLLAYEEWNLSDLVGFMLITSSNDAATALKLAYEKETGGTFIAAMNTEAKTLGMTRSNFMNETGLDIGEKPSNTGSARDAAILLASALKELPEGLDATRHDSLTFTSRTGNTHTVKSTNVLANTIPWAVGAKTGFTDSAGGNLAVSFDVTLGRPVVIVVLGSSREGRFSDMEKLVTATLSFFEDF